MRKIRYLRYFSFILTLVIVFSSLYVFTSLNIFAAKKDDYHNDTSFMTTDESLHDIFTDVKVSKCKYIYNLDDSADYIYVEFENGGYAIFSRETMEMMEYSLKNVLPYSDSFTKNYYAGPANYLKKLDSNFVNMITDEKIDITSKEIAQFSQNTRAFIKSKTTYTYDIDCNNNNDIIRINNILNSSIDTNTFSYEDRSPEIDDYNLIKANTGIGNLIPNYNYFIADITGPIHGKNEDGGVYGNGNTGTCGAVAAQLLLSYNNYYNDRRIIEDRYLNGYNDSANMVDDPEKNPNYCYDPMKMNRYTLGTRSDDTGTNSFYSKVVTTIMKPNTNGAYLDEVCDGIDSILNENLSSKDYFSYYELSPWLFEYLYPISSTPIKREIDAGRPLIISLSEDFGGYNHDVVGYGYQDYTYPNGEGTYEGYVVHFGWTGRNCVWINSSWCKGYLSLKMKHTHNYSIDTGKNISNDKREVRCNECGHRLSVDLYDVEGDTITGINYPVSGTISIPSEINGHTINRIGKEAFKGNSDFISITIPYTVKTIDSGAFENCSNLQNLTLSENLFAIGTDAFKGCSSLNSITLPSSVEYIDDDAFRNCSSLSLVNVQREVSSITNLGQNCFSGCNQSLQIVVPMNRVAEYKNKENWVNYKTKIISLTNDYEEINLNCLSNFDKLISLETGYNKLFKLNIECAKSYKISTSQNLGVSFIIYNSAMDIVATGENTISSYLTFDTYYLSIEFSDNSNSGSIIANFELVWGNLGEDAYYNTNNDITTHLHQTSSNNYLSKLKYYHGQGSGLYKFVLAGADLSGNEIIYLNNIMTIYSDSSRSNILDRYNLNSSINLAINEFGENVMYVYLPYDGYYYIDINTNSNEYKSLTLNILSISETLSFDYLNEFEISAQRNIFKDITDASYFKQVTISHNSKLILEVFADNRLYAGLSIFIFQKLLEPGYEPGDDHFYIVPMFVSSIDNIDSSSEFTIILDAGTYYFGYSYNNGMSLSFNLTRLVNHSDEMYNTLITDPGAGFVPGSEVKFNNGNYGGLTITEGFTRNLFFSSEYINNWEISRLDYDWYSSNSNIAYVSEFGTVLALKVSHDTNVKIYAVNKADPSIVYCIELTVLKETSTDEIEIYSYMSYSYQEENDFYQLELDFDNCPFPMIQYYVWNTYSDDVTIDLYWGYVTSSGPGMVSIVGTYMLNSRIHIFISLTIIE